MCGYCLQGSELSELLLSDEPDQFDDDVCPEDIADQDLDVHFHARLQCTSQVIASDTAMTSLM